MHPRSTAPLPRPWPRRVPDVASVAYVAVLAVWVDAGREPLAWLVGSLAVILAIASSGSDRRPSRAAGWGSAVVAASVSAHAGNRGLDALGALGAFACVSAACVAVARIPSDGGLADVRKPSPALAVIAAGVAWWVAAVERFVAPAGAIAALPGHPAAAPASWLAIVASAAALLGITEWTLRRRRLELGVVERATAMRALLVALGLAAVVAALLSSARAESVARLAVAAGGSLSCAAALRRDAVAVARAARRAIVLGLVGGSVAVFGAAVAEGSGRVWTITLATAVAVLVIGAFGSAMEGPLRPAGGAWLDAFERACDEAIRSDPAEAIRGALGALRGPTGLEAPSPELWTFHPTRVSTVDSAGYLRDAEAELPEALVLLAAAEPEAMLRTEVLDALEVRRPELRSLARWMTGRGAMLAVVVASEGETEGLLVLPQGARGEPPTLEEARALKRVADHLARACEQRGAQARMLARVLDANRRADEAEERTLLLLHERTLESSRDALAAVRLARPATVGVYSAASRAALEALERRTAVGAAVAIVAPSGVDPVPYIARAHLAGARRAAPLVLVDATSVREHDLSRWKNPDVSPLALANRGLLVLLDGAALPADVQELVARALSEKRAPWERPDALDIELALTGTTPPERLVAQGRLAAALALRLADAVTAPVELPRLRDRPEDLRAIVTDRLAREGLRVLGRPLGIEQAAFARLVDYRFPGEDAELGAVVQRLVAACASDGREIVGAVDVDALGLGRAAAAGAEGAAADERRRKDPISA